MGNLRAKCCPICGAAYYLDAQGESPRLTAHMRAVHKTFQPVAVIEDLPKAHG